MLDSQEDQLIHSAARRLKGRERRLFITEMTIELCEGNARLSESRFRWRQETANTGMQELPEGIVIERAPAGGRSNWEHRHPQLGADIRAIVEPTTQTDPKLRSSRRYTNPSAGKVRKALIEEKALAPRMCRPSARCGTS